MSKDVLLSTAMIFDNPLPFNTCAVCSFETDFSAEESMSIFLTHIAKFLYTATYQSRFERDAKTIIYILENLIKDGRYHKLHIPFIKRIIIRNAEGRGIIINNSASNNNQTLFFDMGTVRRQK